MPKNRCALVLACMTLAAAPMALAESETPIVIEGQSYVSWQDFVHTNDVEGSDFRCRTPNREIRSILYPDRDPIFGETSFGDPADCTTSSTNPTSDYDPNVTYEVQVVVHILMDNACSQGVISDEMVDSQILILNEDFQAIFGSNGAAGTNVNINFVLADTDPDGDPTTGITRTCNTTYFNDSGAYYNELNWDPHRYLNIYTNTASGALGYVPFLPMDSGGALVGTPADRVVNLWSAFGLNAPIGHPFDLGRTVTHEVGHYLGLEHTFSGGCGTSDPPGCYSSGDLICDTNAESSPHSGCNGADSSCGSPDPIDNYMDYSDDICMEMFTLEQARRMRCAIQSYRPDLFTVANTSDIFTDGFESGNTSAWSLTQP